MGIAGNVVDMHSKYWRVDVQRTILRTDVPIKTTMECKDMKEETGEIKSNTVGEGPTWECSLCMGKEYV